MSVGNSLTILGLQGAVAYAARSGEWVVVVYPTVELAKDARRVLPGLVPEGSTGAGRTFLVPGGGRVTVMTAAEPLLKGDRKYGVMFLEWLDATDKELDSMSVWVTAASRVLSPSAGQARA